MQILKKIVNSIRSIANNGWITHCLEIYTDGSFKQGRGSWAYVVVCKGKIVREASGSVLKTNSLRMELQAGIEALRSLPMKSRAMIMCDSRIVVDIFKDPTVKYQGRPNEDLIETLRDLNQQHSIQWKWIKAHSGIVHNERCDELCVMARQ